jgi:hypothetical protein
LLLKSKLVQTLKLFHEIEELFVSDVSEITYELVQVWLEFLWRPLNCRSIKVGRD